MLRVWKVSHDASGYPPIYCKTVGDFKYVIDLLLGFNEDDTELRLLYHPTITIEEVEMSQEEFDALEPVDP